MSAQTKTVFSLEKKLALVSRALETEAGTKYLFQAAKLPIPESLADTKEGRVSQFCVAAKLSLASLKPDN